MNKLKIGCVGFLCSLWVGNVGANRALLSCYQKASDPTQELQCLEKEYKAVRREHKDVVERVAAIAKAWDKPYRTRQRWTKFIQAGQSYDTYVTRECQFFGWTTKGNRTKEKIAEMGCKVNLYRARIDMLENRYLSSGK